MRFTTGLLMLALVSVPHLAAAQTNGYRDNQRQDDEIARQDLELDSRYRDYEAKRALREFQGYERERIGPEGRRLLIVPPPRIDPYEPLSGRSTDDFDARR